MQKLSSQSSFMSEQQQLSALMLAKFIAALPAFADQSVWAQAV